jgi:hypothetical protein
MYSKPLEELCVHFTVCSVHKFLICIIERLLRIAFFFRIADGCCGLQCALLTPMCTSLNSRDITGVLFITDGFYHLFCFL